MPNTAIEDLRFRLAQAEAEIGRLRIAPLMSSQARDTAFVAEQITGRDDGTDPFVAAVRATPMPIVVSDPRLPDNPIVFANDAFCRLSGYARSEIVGRNCRFLQGPETDPATVATIRTAVRNVEPLRADILNYRKTGEPFWNRLMMAPVRDAEGALAYFFASQVDVTLERERLENLETHNAALMAEMADRLHEQQDSASRLRFAAQAGRFGIWDLDLATGELTASDVLKTIFGCSTDRPFTIEDWEARVHPDDRAARADAQARSIATGADLETEYRIGRPDGAIAWLQVRAQVVSGEAGGNPRMAGVCLDVTARAAADLRRGVLIDLGDRIRDLDEPADLAFAAAEILGRTFGVSRAGFGTVDLTAETISIERDWNAPGVKSLAGVLQFRDYGSYIEDLKRGTLVAFADARTDPRTMADAKALEAISARALLNLPVEERSGFVALVYLNHAEARDWHEEEIGLVREVAERVQVAIQRRRAERDLQRLAASLERDVEERTRERDQLWAWSEDLLLIADYEGRFLRVSPSWTRHLGWSTEHLVTHPYTEIIHPDDVEVSMGSIQAMRDSGRPAQFENRLRDLEGQWHWIAWQLSPEPGGERMTGTGRDITVEKAQRAELDLAQESLRQAQKMEAVGQLTGGVAHDFNNLLTVIRSSVDLLKRSNLSEERRNRYVEAISDTTSRAAKLTGQLLAFARRQALTPEVFDVAESVRAIGDMVGTLTGSRIRIVTAVPAEPCLVNADASQFDTAVVNLAVNARDAMEGGGTLTVSVGTAAAIPALRAHPEIEGDVVTVTIGDTGVGIAARDLDRIFEPFFTTKGIGQGTGLGLSQVFGFVKQSGGEVGVSSEPGRGTEFTLYLPRVADRPNAMHLEADDQPVVDGHGTCILVVEDNIDVGSFATQTLDELGYRSVLARDAEAALQELSQDADRFDIVFSDVVMPGMNGIDLAREIRRRHADLPIVLTSGYSHVLAENGTYGFELLHKPYSIEQLSRVLARAAHWRKLKRTSARRVPGAG